MATIKRKFDHYTLQVLADLSADIGDPDRYREKQVLTRLSIFLSSEISLSSPTLHHHLRGFVAVVKARGGIQAVLESNEIRRNWVWLAMMTIIVTNTTSPSSGQMAEEDYFTNEDLYAYITGDFNTAFPCPTQLFLCLRDINRLRREIAGGRRTANSPALQGAALAIIRDIASFAPEAWTERYALPERALVRLQLALVFKSATMLYGMMTLAAHAGMPFPAHQRFATADVIVELVLSIMQVLGYDELAMVWPLMVAGASLGRAARSKQAVVDGLLLGISRGPCPSVGVYLGLECLRRFWKSGKTEWDECFTTWQATVP
ncbi:fungal specific transcription factordomain-containing protein [Cordyceps javanica]|uniref:Fungal specific transcription factordomain-containing protein n=1 Tax=Cordyceps javanica TaxID=43265 RepID=A0A545V3Y3_9HYPO|nr:fungal specific transcription factordomain-containing protein [Cordyceps javanica]TQW07713.1 fungal specific transcription factor domain-containing protein [Cordyceps javanica]